MVNISLQCNQLQVSVFETHDFTWPIFLAPLPDFLSLLLSRRMLSTWFFNHEQVVPPTITDN
jgi:hypothetical protein